MAIKKGTKFTKAHRLALSKAAKARYAKKRGVKPGTKRGKYRRSRKPSPITLDQYADLIEKQFAINKERQAKLDKEFVITSTTPHTFNVGDRVTFDTAPKYTPAQPLTLCGQLEDAILLLENRLSNAIAKINSLM